MYRGINSPRIFNRLLKLSVLFLALSLFPAKAQDKLVDKLTLVPKVNLSNTPALVQAACRNLPVEVLPKYPLVDSNRQPGHQGPLNFLDYDAGCVNVPAGTTELYLRSVNEDVCIVADDGLLIELKQGNLSSTYSKDFGGTGGTPQLVSYLELINTPSGQVNVRGMADDLRGATMGVPYAISLSAIKPAEKVCNQTWPPRGEFKAYAPAIIKMQSLTAINYADRYRN